MGALTYHEDHYATDWPEGEKRALEIVTFDNKIEIRIGAAGAEAPRNRRTSVILTKQEAAALQEDLQRATDYVYGGA
jgi:hypothetical protein